MSGNTKSDGGNFAKLSGTIKDTIEYSAVKELHQKYNKLSGFSAMLEMIRGYKTLSYAFVFLSILVSTYTFHIDLKSAFSEVNIYILVGGGLFLAVAFEALKDISAIALFNAKMEKGSRVLGSLFFVVALGALFTFHLKAMNQYERMAIISAINSKDTKVKDLANPKLQLALKTLLELEADKVKKEAEKTPELTLKLTSQYPNQRRDSKAMIDSINAELAKIKANIAIQNELILDEKINSNKDIADNQTNISAVLLLLILIIEVFATLGIVAKMITVDNASRELARHSEVVDEYVNVVDEMKRVNDNLTRVLGESVRNQADTTQALLKVITDDIKTSSDNNLTLIKELAEGKNTMMKDTQKVLSKIANTNLKYLDEPQKNDKIETVEATLPKAQIAKPQSRDLVGEMFDFGKVKIGEKLVSKSTLIDVENRSEDKQYKETTTLLVSIGAIEMKRGFGYYAVMSYEDTKKQMELK